MRQCMLLPIVLEDYFKITPFYNESERRRRVFVPLNPSRGLHVADLAKVGKVSRLDATRIFGSLNGNE